VLAGFNEAINFPHPESMQMYPAEPCWPSKLANRRHLNAAAKKIA